MALDQITKALVDEFLSESGMPSAGVASDFEKFVAYVVTSPHIDAAIDYENVMTGSGGDTGLDAIAMVVNGELVTDPDEIDALASSGATLDVTYISCKLRRPLLSRHQRSGKSSTASKTSSPTRRP